jgi:transcription antitermination factor NusG
VLQVRTSWAFRVRDALLEAGVEAWFPTYTETVKWSDRSKAAEKQLFPGYVFARFASDEAAAVLEFPGIDRILPCNLHPIAIDDAEISSLRFALASKLPARPCPYVTGETVTIDSGALSGVSGIVVKTRGSARVVVGIEMLGRAVSIEMDAADIKKRT